MARFFQSQVLSFGITLCLRVSVLRDMVPSQRVVCLGLSHRTAPVAIREQLSFAPVVIEQTLRHVRETACFEEFVVLSTCNRVEFYACPAAHQQTDVFSALLKFVAQMPGVDPAALTPYFYRHETVEAAHHLCRVAAGLDSMVLGEPQILGQVGAALRLSEANELAGPVLTALFQTALKAGKRARAETALNRNPVSVGSVAVDLARRVFGDLATMRATVVGAGEVGQLVVKILTSRKVGHLTVVNRNEARAASLAQRMGCAAAPLHQLSAQLAASDVVISTTQADAVLIEAAQVAAAMHRRADRPLVLIDLAVPRDIDPAVADLENVRLFDIDQLREAVEASLDERRKEIPQVEALIAEELDRLLTRLCETTVEPVIAGLRRKAEAIRRQELERALRTMDSLDDEAVEQLHYFSRALVNKLLHDPTIRLRQGAVDGEAEQYTALVRSLFSL